MCHACWQAGHATPSQTAQTPVYRRLRGATLLQDTRARGGAKARVNHVIAQNTTFAGHVADQLQLRSTLQDGGHTGGAHDVGKAFRSGDWRGRRRSGHVPRRRTAQRHELDNRAVGRGDSLRGIVGREERIGEEVVDCGANWHGRSLAGEAVYLGTCGRTPGSGRCEGPPWDAVRSFGGGEDEKRKVECGA